MTHFLFTAVPWSTYHIDSAAILGGVLTEIATNLESLFWDGIDVNGTKYYFALIGVKGDAEFHVDAGQFSRSYFTVGTANNLYMCPECEADDNFGDVSNNPIWHPSVPGFTLCFKNVSNIPWVYFMFQKCFEHPMGLLYVSKMFPTSQGFILCFKNVSNIPFNLLVRLA